MKRTRAILLCSVLVTVLSSFSVAALAAEATVEVLWPGGAPGAKGQEPGDIPKLTIYLPPKDTATGAAVVICPGGGYGHLAMDHEGHQIAQWLNSFGVAGFILQYRHSGSGAGYQHPAPLQDAQRAIRTVRGRAAEWGLKPDRIGILGFSAGGHLTATASTHFNWKVYEPRDEIDKASARPDFAVPIYPVISSTEWYTHKGSMHNLLGANPDPKLVEKLSMEKQVTSENPPTFLMSTWEDTGVPPENTIAFYLALHKAKVPAEMHIFAKGPHGVGLGRHIPGTRAWSDLCAEWMKTSGFLDK